MDVIMNLFAKRVSQSYVRPGREGAMKKRVIVMVMDDSELREQIESIFNDTESKFANENIVTRFKETKEEMMSLLDKCNAFNVISQKWSKPRPNAAHIDKDTTPDRLKQAIDVTMERLDTWSPKSWADLVKELRSEIKVAYDKFSNVRKRYYGWIETSQGNQLGELVKAYIARDIQDYVKYGINICMLCIIVGSMITPWLRKIAIHFEFLAGELKGLNVRNETKLRRFAEDVSLYKQCMLNFADCFESGLDNSNSEAYLMLRQKGGIRFSDLIERKKNELGFVDEFEHLKNPQQLEVYQRIIDEFGGANISDFQFVDFIFGDGPYDLFFLLFRFLD